MNQSSLPLIIVNPSSAGGATGEHWAGIASDIRTHFGAFECLFTQKADDARAALETRRSWLVEAEKTLTDLRR